MNLIECFRVGFYLGACIRFCLFFTFCYKLDFIVFRSCTELGWHDRAAKLMALSLFVLMFIYQGINQALFYLLDQFTTFVFSFLADCSHLVYFPCLHSILFSAVLASD